MFTSYVDRTSEDCVGSHRLWWYICLPPCPLALTVPKRARVNLIKSRVRALLWIPLDIITATETMIHIALTHLCRRFGKDMKVVHFIGPVKPWHHAYNTTSRQVETQASTGHNQQFLQLWWDIFMDKIQPGLEPDVVRIMAGNCAQGIIRYSYFLILWFKICFLKAFTVWCCHFWQSRGKKTTKLKC